MGFETPNEDIGRVDVCKVDWIKGVGNSVQSRFHALLPIRFDFSDYSRKLAQINIRVDEGWKIIHLLFPVNHCTIIPRFTVITCMSTVCVAPSICVQSKALK